MDSTGVPDATIDTLTALGLTQSSCTINRQKGKVSDTHYQTVNDTLSDYTEMAKVLNVDNYHSIHSEKMPNTTKTSTAAHLATILLNPIKNQPAISNINIHNPILVDVTLIKSNIEALFMTLFSYSHNQRWGFCVINNEMRLEELTVYSYNTQLKEKKASRSMKDLVLVDLQKNPLHSVNDYIKVLNAVISIPAMKRYVEEGKIIPVVAD